MTNDRRRSSSRVSHARDNITDQMASRAHDLTNNKKAKRQRPNSPTATDESETSVLPDGFFDQDVKRVKTHDSVDLDREVAAFQRLVSDSTSEQKGGLADEDDTEENERAELEQEIDAWSRVNALREHSNLSRRPQEKYQQKVVPDSREEDSDSEEEQDCLTLDSCWRTRGLNSARRPM